MEITSKQSFADCMHSAKRDWMLPLPLYNQLKSSYPCKATTTGHPTNSERIQETFLGGLSIAFINY